jgi:hypothetical protein
VDDVNNVRREAGRHFSNRKREYLKDKTDELATHSRDLYRGINELNMGKQPRPNLVKDEPNRNGYRIQAK